MLVRSIFQAAAKLCSSELEHLKDLLYIPDFLNSFAFMKFVVVAAPERPAIIGKNGL